MNQKQYEDLKADLLAVFEKHGFDPINLKVKGQKSVEKKILRMRDQPYQIYHPETYGSPAIFEEFQKTRNLKLVWARMSSAVRIYELDPYEVAEISRDRCGVTGALIDYGYGYNQITDNPYFRPGIDHIQAVANGGKKFGDITNIQIVSQHFNTIKNYGSIIDALKWTRYELSHPD